MSAFVHTLSFPLIAFLLQSVVIAGFALLAGHFAAKRGTAIRVAVYRSGILAILVLLALAPVMRTFVRPWYEVTSVPAAANELAASETGSPAQRSRVLTAPETRSRLTESASLPSVNRAQPVIQKSSDLSSVPSATKLPPTYELFGGIFLAGGGLLIGTIVAGLA